MDTSKLADALRRDITALTAPEGYLYAGIPEYKHLFGRDASIAAWQLLPFQPATAAATLRVLARYQGSRVRHHRDEQPGKILHEHYVHGLPEKLAGLGRVQNKWAKLSILAWRFPYYGSVDSTAWWLILLGEYYHQTQDADLVRELWPQVQAAIGWLSGPADENHDGLVDYESAFFFGLFHQGWKDNLNMDIAPPVALVEVQGYYYRACRLIAELAQEVVPDAKIADTCTVYADRFKAQFAAKFRIEEENYYALAIDGHGQPVATVTSNPGHLLFTGLLDPAQADAVVARLFADDLWTPFGIRTHSTRDALFAADHYHRGSVWPHDNWIIYQGLRTSGFSAEAERVKTSLIKAFSAMGYLPELYGVRTEHLEIFELPRASRQQAWSAAGLLSMLSEPPRTRQSKDVKRKSP